LPWRDKKRKADDFLALHHASTNFLLPNAWDVASGKISEIEGFKAIGTTSAGISSTLGYADGQRMRLTENMEVVRRIVKSTPLQDKIKAIREMADAYLDDEASTHCLRHAVERGNAYKEAGADCIFVPDVGGIESAAAVVAMEAFSSEPHTSSGTYKNI